MGYEVRVVCDRCGKGFWWENTPIGIVYARKRARKKGWSVGEKWLCSACKKENGGERE